MKNLLLFFYVLLLLSEVKTCAYAGEKNKDKDKDKKAHVECNKEIVEKLLIENYVLKAKLKLYEGESERIVISTEKSRPDEFSDSVTHTQSVINHYK